MSRFHDMGGMLKLPEMVEIDPVEVCNLRCRMCHVSFMPTEPRPVFDIGLLPRLQSLRGAYVSVASGFEPLLYRDFDRFMRGLSDLGMRLQIITNGTLLSPDKIETLLASNMEIVNFSFDGIRKETFEHIRRGANYERTLDCIRATREAFRGRDTSFLVNSTVMRRNLEETIETIDFWDRMDFDVVRFLLMIVREPDPELIRESLFPARERARRVFEEAALHVIRGKLRTLVLLPFFYPSEVARQFSSNCVDLYVGSGNPASRLSRSLRERFQRGPHVLMSHTDCRAAFNAATILANGDIQLCYKYVVGNLHRNSFEEIWFGEEADRIRRRITGSPADCIACDCYRFGIAFHRLDSERVENYFARELVPYIGEIDFHSGTVKAEIHPRPPRLVTSEGSYNIVAYDNRYVGIPQSLGPFEIDKVDLSSLEGVILGDSFFRVQREIWERLGRCSSREPDRPGQAR